MPIITDEQLKQTIEAAIMAAGEPLTVDKMLALFEEEKEPPTRDAVKAAIKQIEEECETRGVELKKVSSGYRFQAKKDFSPWVSRLWEEKPARYSRALLETLVLVAYKQPITRGEIEHVRGVAVSTNIIKTLLERDWVKVVGHRDVPGKPALYATTKAFLDYFNLNSLEELPTLSEIRDLDKITAELNLQEPVAEQASEDEAPEAQASATDVAEAATAEQQENIETTEAETETEATEEDIDTNLEDRDDIMLSESEAHGHTDEVMAEEEQAIADTEIEIETDVAEPANEEVVSEEENLEVVAASAESEEAIAEEESREIAEASVESFGETSDDTTSESSFETEGEAEVAESAKEEAVSEEENLEVVATSDEIADEPNSDIEVAAEEVQPATVDVVSDDEEESLETVSTGEEGDEEYSAEEKLDSKFVG